MHAVSFYLTTSCNGTLLLILGSGSGSISRYNVLPNKLDLVVGSHNDMSILDMATDYE